MFRLDKRPHILVVDDEPDICWALENILRPAGYAVTTTTSGAEAIEKAQGRFFNLALLDIKLPDMEGIELVAPLKEMHPDMVVMIVTAYASLETAVQALNGGASAYITKPLNVDEVLATVRGALEKQRLVMEKRQVEEALRESEARYRLLAENANDAIYMLDSDLRITDVNPFTEQAIGYSQDELIGRSLPELGLLAPASLGLALEDAARVLAGERISRAVYEFITKGGRHLFGEVSGAPIYQEGQVIGVLAIARDITERKRAEERILRQSAVLEAINRVFRETLTCETDEEVARTCLVVAEELSGSKFGFIGEVNQAGRFDTIAISDPGWEACKMPDSETTKLIKNMKIRGIDRSVLREEKSRIVNDPASHRDRVGTPEGHPPITSFLGVPLKQAGRTIGMIGLANKESDYDLPDQQAVEALSVAFVEALYRKRAEQKARRHLERIEALREIDKAIISTLDLSEVLNVILEELQRVIPYHSAAIFLITDGTAKLTAGRGFPDMEHALQVSFPIEEDALTRELLQEKRPLVLTDAQADERFQARGGTEYVRSWIGVPLIAKGREVGFLTIDHREPGVYDEESAEMAQAFGSQVAIAIENARLYQESQRRAEEMAALREVSLATLSTLERDQVFEIMLDQLGTVIDHDTAAIKIITPDGRDKMIAGRGPIIDDQSMWNGFDVKDNKLVQEMKETRQPVVVHDTHTDDRYERVGDWEAFHSWAGAPLFVRGDFIGYLAVEKASPGFYNENTVQLLGDFARAAAIALENARLYEDIQRELAERKRVQEELQRTLEKLRKALGGIIQAMALTVESRDPYTAGHQRGVSNLARAIADEMGLSEEQIDGIRMAGLIHDMGKINVPAEILSKPGRLSDLEFGLIKMHPQAGYDILKTIDVPWPVAQIVLQHHERMDGSGYPQGLSGEEIMLEARILAVADVVEAMASHRPYRPAHGIDTALGEISQNRGVLYDPEVVDACLRLFTEKGFGFA